MPLPRRSSTRRGGNRPSWKRLWLTIRSRCRRVSTAAEGGSWCEGEWAGGLIAAAAADDAKKLAEAVEKLHMQLEELKQRGVHVIVREGDQYVAWIGDRMLHVGDEINGFTVTAIDPDGVHVERKESP